MNYNAYSLMTNGNLIALRRRLEATLSTANWMSTVIVSPRMSNIQVTKAKVGFKLDPVPDLVSRFFSAPSPIGSVQGNATQTSSNSGLAVNVLSTASEDVGVVAWAIDMSAQDLGTPIVAGNLTVRQMRDRNRITAQPLSAPSSISAAGGLVDFQAHPDISGYTGAAIPAATQATDDNQQYQFQMLTPGSSARIYVLNCNQQADTASIILDPARVVTSQDANFPGYDGTAAANQRSVPAQFYFSGLPTNAQFTVNVQAVVPGSVAMAWFVEDLEALTAPKA